MSTDPTASVLAAIDGALADAEFPDAMRWTPEPETVTDAPAPFDGELVWQPPQRYEPPAGSGRVPWPDLYERARSGLELSLECGGLDHAACPGCGLCSCHDRSRRWPAGRYQVTERLYVPGQPAEERTATFDAALDFDPGLPLGPRNFPRITTQRGGIRFYPPPERGPAATPAGLDELFPPGDRGSDALRALAQLRATPPTVPRRPLSEALLLQLAANPEETLESLAPITTALIEAFRPVAEAVGRMLSELGKAFAQVPSLPPALAQPAEDPRTRALRLRRERGTGPDRQIQHQRPPRRHVL